MKKIVRWKNLNWALAEFIMTLTAFGVLVRISSMAQYKFFYLTKGPTGFDSKANGDVSMSSAGI